VDLKFVSAGLFVATIAAETACLFFLIRSNNHKKYSALAAYLLLVALSGLAFGLVPWLTGSLPGQLQLNSFFWASSWRDLLIGILFVFITQQLFREIMVPLPGLSRLGVLACEWLIAVTIIVSITASHFSNISIAGMMATTVTTFFLCACVLCIALLIFVTVIAKRVGLSYLSRPYGVSLGLGIIALAEFAYSTLSPRHAGAISPPGIAVAIGQLVACCIWAWYLVKPEPPRVPIALPPASDLRRWNRITLAFGRPVEQAPPAPKQEFFLTEVEKVVDKVLTENPLPDSSVRDTTSC
jgi:hypothetical protein